MEKIVTEKWERLYEQCTPDERLSIVVEMLKRIEARKWGRFRKGRKSTKRRIKPAMNSGTGSAGNTSMWVMAG
ncbi:MAG: hypothetical protein HY865_26125 [Chloroflexi bacterium]|nr:hypothetical protein [Chloroflexota bacterium]